MLFRALNAKPEVTAPDNRVPLALLVTRTILHYGNGKRKSLWRLFRVFVSFGISFIALACEVYMYGVQVYDVEDCWSCGLNDELTRC